MNYIEDEAREQFLKFLAENEIDISDLNLVTHKDVRCRVIGDKHKKKSGRYKLFLDDRANGWCINYLQGGEFVSWSYQLTEEERREWGRRKRAEEIAQGKVYDPKINENERSEIAAKLKQEEEDKIKQRLAREEQFKLRKEQEDAELALVFEEVCDAIEVELHRNTMECTSHPYLTKKQVEPCEGLLQIMMSYHIEDILDEESDGQYMNEGDLIIPLYNKDARLVTYQSINDNGDIKKFRLNGTKFEAFFIIGASSLDDLDEFYYAEGYATGASVYAVTGKPVICCFDIGNLVAVIKVLYAEYPDKLHTIFSDNDYYKFKKKQSEGDLRAKNVGLSFALAARGEMGVRVVFPIFPKYFSASDWNDLVVYFGEQIAKQQIAKQLRYQEEFGELILDNEPEMKSISENMKYKEKCF